jgi:hypothetical protein
VKAATPRYPWCTGAPRPTLISNLDAQVAIISYYTAPICHAHCRTAVIELRGVVRLESMAVNDEENVFLRSGLTRDVIHVKQLASAVEYLFLFHNEWIRATAAALQEFPGGGALMDNLKRHCHPDFDRD